MRITSWNVNGMRAVLGKDLRPWSVVRGSDVVCLQETKAQPDQIDPGARAPRGWRSYWHSAKKKGYSGVALYCREQPDELIQGLGEDAYDDEGRLLAARFGELVIASAYFPNSQNEGRRLDYKLGYCAAIERFFAAQIKRGRQVLVIGDYNIAHQPMDLARPKANESNPGYLPEEREWFSRFIGLGHVDLFRVLYPDRVDAYTWWSYRAQARSRNIGWRIDVAGASAGLADRLKEVKHHPDILGSDHCPVSVELT